MLVTNVPDARADWLVLASTHNRNALSEQLLNELIDHVRRSARSARRALVIDHEGKAFCSGVDLRERSAGDGPGPHSALLSTLLRELWAFPKPVIGRVDGLVRGGGMALLACCDLVVAGEASNFGYSEVRVGVVPALVMAVTFPKLSHGHVGPWMLTGTPFGTNEARRIGLVTRAVETGGVVTIEPELDAIARGGPAAIALTKKLLRHETANRVISAIDEMEKVSHEIFETAEAKEGMTAFTEKRSPVWLR
jgi:enoyl-CoA hydratase/carnithine racemase